MVIGPKPGATTVFVSNERTSFNTSDQTPLSGLVSKNSDSDGSRETVRTGLTGTRSPLAGDEVSSLALREQRDQNENSKKWRDTNRTDVVQRVSTRNRISEKRRGTIIGRHVARKNLQLLAMVAPRYDSRALQFVDDRLLVKTLPLHLPGGESQQI